MNVVSDEVFAVILALVVVGSVISTAAILRPEVTEAFTALGLLNRECRIGDYPEYVIIGSSVDLCMYVFNYMGYPVLAQIRYKVGSVRDLPTNTTPSVLETLENFTVVVAHNNEKLVKASLPVMVNGLPVGKNVTLIFELWLYDTNRGEWTYSGRWAHLHVKVVEVPVP
ncbi:MAG: DUF1616 domain-containing protein [Zestosphaera sp.]